MGASVCGCNIDTKCFNDYGDYTMEGCPDECVPDWADYDQDAIAMQQAATTTIRECRSATACTAAQGTTLRYDNL